MKINLILLVLCFSLFGRNPEKPTTYYKVGNRESAIRLLSGVNAITIQCYNVHKDSIGLMYDGLSKTQALILLKDSTLIDTFFRVISSLDLNITQINLDFIPFDSIPSSIGRINKVKILNLRSCKLKGIPPSIGNLPQLNHIELSNNPAMNFDSTFRILGKCDSLKVLHLSNNKLYSLPCSICLLQRLVYLTIDKDSLSVLPDCFKGLNNLKWLDISDNQFQHLPILLYDMKNLGVIEGTGNKFSTAEKEKIFNYPNRKFGYRL